MAAETGGFDIEVLGQNAVNLADNPYPGRGIVLGVSEGGEKALQAYWVMGRSENSRNRVLVQDDETVRTEAHDPSKVEDPSLIIYNAMLSFRFADFYRSEQAGKNHVVSNGDQTDDVWNRGRNPSAIDRTLNHAFRNALSERAYEPDAPNFTPRITGMIALNALPTYQYSIIRRNPTTGRPEHTFGSGNLGDIPEGAGICFHTYDGDGDPLPAFSGSPYALPVGPNAQETSEALWDLLDEENRVAIVTKEVDRQTGEVGYSIINQLED